MSTQIESETLYQTPDRTLTPKELRKVLRDWDLLKALGEHPLADWNIVKVRQQAAGYSATALGRGLALREVLQSALNTLKPGNDYAPQLEKHSRPYFILIEQFVHGRNPDWVQQQLHISRGTYYDEQQRALEMLASVLQRQEAEHRHSRESENAIPALHPGTVAPIPFMAPPRPAQILLGRDRLFGAIKQRLLNGSGRGWVVLSGLPGVGKSTLAIELAHDPEVLTHFQDGVLWAGLGRQPDVWAMLGSWAAALGVPSEVIASRATVAELATVVHAAIGLRRLLLIVDDAWQVEDLLAFGVGGPHCAQLVTTRLADVAGSLAGDQAIRVCELDQEDGLNLLAQLSPRAVELAPTEARTLVQSVGGLPLALILMGHYLRKQSYNAPARRLRQALANLRTSRTRLQLDVPNPLLDTHPDLPPGTPLSLQIVIGLSDAALDAAAHQALIDLAVFSPKPNSFSEEAALAVTAAPPLILDQLVEQGLLEAIEPDRYTLHQTIADYAALQCTDQTATRRLIDYCVQYVETNASNFPALEMEFGNILPAVEVTLKLQRHAEAIRLIKALYPFLEMRGLYQPTEQFLHQGSALAEAVGDAVSRATFLQGLGDLAIKRGQFRLAQAHLRESIELAKATQAGRLEAEALLNLGLACSYAGDPLLAQGKPLYLHQALQLARQADYRACECLVLDALGYAYEELCDYPTATACLEQALSAARENGQRRAEGWAHFHLGTVELATGNFAEAEAQSQRCLQIYREVGDRRGQGWIIYQLGRIHRQLGHAQTARAAFTDALRDLSEIGDWMGQGFCIHNLGLIDNESGGEDAAFDRFELARSIFRQIECVKGEAQAIFSLGQMHRKRGNYEAARDLLEQALHIRRSVGFLRGESKALADLGRVRLQLGDAQGAIDYGCQAVHLAERIGARPTHAYNLTQLGHIWADLERWDEAGQAYQLAVNLRQELGQPRLLAEPLLGLAEACLNRSDAAQARALVDEVLGNAVYNVLPVGQVREWGGVDGLNQFYARCYRLLSSLGDPRAGLISNLLSG